MEKRERKRERTERGENKDERSRGPNEEGKMRDGWKMHKSESVGTKRPWQRMRKRKRKKG